MPYQELRLVIVDMETGELEPVVHTMARTNVPGAAACLMEHLKHIWNSDLWEPTRLEFSKLMTAAEEVMEDIIGQHEYRCGLCQHCFPVTNRLYQRGPHGIRICANCNESGLEFSCLCPMCT